MVDLPSANLPEKCITRHSHKNRDLESALARVSRPGSFNETRATRDPTEGEIDATRHTQRLEQQTLVTSKTYYTDGRGKYEADLWGTTRSYQSAKKASLH